MHLAEATAVLTTIPDGAQGIDVTLSHMSRLSRDGRKNLQVIQTARALIQNCPPKDWACQVRALHAFVRDQIQYVLDPVDVEMVQTPMVTLDTRAGDCDDKSVLLAALLGAIGHPSRYRAIGFEPGIFCHVYVETKIGDQWIPLETTEPVPVGWEPPPQLVKAQMFKRA